jgi:hypothetical protein
MTLYLWYSPKLNQVRLLPMGECRETKKCRWDRCAYVTFKRGKYGKCVEVGAFYYIGEFL